METTEGVLAKWPESKMPVRFSDCDLYGHLNNVWYLKYFLDAREDHLAHSYGLSLAAFAQKGTGWVVASSQIAYFKPARVGEHVILRSGLLSFQNTSVLVEMQMWDVQGKQLKATMWSKFVHIGLKDGRRMDIDAELTNLFEQIAIGGFEEGDFGKRMAELKNTTGYTVNTKPV